MSPRLVVQTTDSLLYGHWDGTCLCGLEMCPNTPWGSELLPLPLVGDTMGFPLTVSGE